MIYIYKFITIFFYPLFILIIFLRKISGKEDSLRYKEKIFLSSFNIKKHFQKKLIWFHAASIGEIKSVLDLIDKYKSKNYEILITTVTKTAANLVKEKYLNDKSVHHRFFPIDVTFLFAKFLDQWRPKLIIFVDSEIWPNLLMQIKKKEIPSIILNARITKKTYERWKLFPTFAKQVFQVFDLCLASNNQTCEYLKDFKAKNVKNFGNLKLSNKVYLSKFYNKNDYCLKNKKSWCAVSTHKGEDVFFLDTHLIMKNELKNFLTIIIPRHINRCPEIFKLCKKLDLKAQILDKGAIIEESSEVLIVNSFGETAKFLGYSESVFMGKSLLKRLEKVSGQNPIEAAKLGCKIYHGPYYNNFKDIYNQLNKLEISEEISNQKDLSMRLINDIQKTKSNSNKSIEIINNIGEKIFNQNIKEINNFL